MIDPQDEVSRLVGWELAILFDEVALKNEKRVKSKIRNLIKYWQTEFPIYHPPITRNQDL